MIPPDTKRRIVLDATGLVCPYPYLKAKKVLEDLVAGEVLELVTDNEATITSSVPALARRFDLETEVRESGPGRWRVVFRPL